MFHARTKHVEIDYHFIREKVTSNQLCIKYLCSKDQLDDIMTKPLSIPHFLDLKSKLTVTTVPLACGGSIESTLDTSICPQNGEYTDENRRII
jgi:hypothetical protein